MRFLIDESADARLAAHLSTLGHDAALVAQSHRPGLPDAEVLAIARAQGRILITDDRDFGELVFRQRQGHAGVIFFRLSTTVLFTRIERLSQVLTDYADRLDQFLVVTESRVRVRRTGQGGAGCVASNPGPPRPPSRDGATGAVRGGAGKSARSSARAPRFPD